jgi:cell division protein FtsQ
MTVRTPFSERVRAQSTARRRSRLRLVGAAFAVVAVVILAGWVALGTSLLAVHRVVVVGAGPLSAGEVDAVTQTAIGDPMLTVHTGRLERRLDAIPSVAAVSVSRAWPRTLRVKVVERTPVATVETPTNWQLIDASGVLFGGTAARPATLARLAVPSPGPTDGRTTAALAVLRSLPAGLRARVRVIHVPTVAGVTFRLRGGVTVVWGSPGLAARKSAALAGLIRRGPGTYDVSTPSVVTSTGH